MFTHGLALKPGKPTILAVDEPSQTILMGLPGHPAAALMVFRLLAKWLEQWRTGEADSLKIPALAQSNIPAAPGKDTCVMVELFPGDGEGYTARPVLGKSGLMRTLTKADGYVRIPMGKEGLKTGELVWVELFLRCEVKMKKRNLYLKTISVEEALEKYKKVLETVIEVKWERIPRPKV